MRASSPIRKASAHSAVSRTAFRRSAIAALAPDVAAERWNVRARSRDSSALTPSFEKEITSSSSLCDASAEWKKWCLSCIFCRGGLLRPTRLARALKPVSPTPYNRRKYGGASTQRFAAPLGQTLARLTASSSLGNLTDVPEHAPVSRSPTDLLDDLPVYEPSDLNGPLPTRVSSYLPMRTLPFFTASTFYYRSQSTSSDGIGDLSDREEGRGGGSTRGGSSAFAMHASLDEARSDLRHDQGRKDAEELYCRLCREALQPGTSTRSHIVVTGTGSHVNHVVREVALDTLALLAIRGYPIDDILTVWAETLYRSPDLPRIHSLANPQWSIEKRAERLGVLMYALKEAGVIDVSLSRQAPESMTTSTTNEIYRRRRVGYERLEYIGDSFWSVHIAKRLVQLYPDQRWMYGERSFGFNALRDACEMNVNLDFVFDTLQIENLLSPFKAEGLGVGKVKADFVEAILGELHTYVIAHEPKLDDDVAFVEVNGAREAQLCALIQHCLTELYDLVLLQHARQLTHTALPLAKELAVKHIWMQTRPQLLQNKRSSRRHEVTRAGGLSINSNGNREPSGVLGHNEYASQLSVNAKESEAMHSLGVSYATSETAVDESTCAFDSNSAPARQAGEAGTGASVATSALRTDVSAVNEASLTTGATSPGANSTSLSLAASLQLGTTRVLPGLPRLFQAPRARPTHVPHPLRHLPLHAIPKTTYCEHTHADVFAQIVESYHRLRLISDDAIQTRYVASHHPPQWHVLIATLAPQLAHRVVCAGGPEAAVEPYASDLSLLPNGESGGTGDTEFNTAAASSVDDGGRRVQSTDVLNNEAVRRLLTSMSEGELYCRDGFYNLASSPSSTPARRGSASHSGLSVDWTLHNAGLPTLTLEPTQLPGSAVSGNSSSGSDGAACSSFADSRFVPPNTRPPPAGVVTDRNLCRGVFAFLALGVSDAVDEATKALGALQQISTRAAGGAREDKTKKANAAPVAKGADDDAAATQAAGAQTESLAEKMEAAFVFWKRQPRKFSADSIIFHGDKTSGEAKQM
ncbi:putative RNA editing complex protein MP90 putative nuclease [Leptomonas seymouri]|uniref:Putative RNA editing complex protein MP90 putative nuclease n=1 Tax=Leptomonas seymouri TaxID=5684 RepID=A0A0N1PEA0_LEPSE|nr:putative RNA editing complex protein MP90 putative nuclease [Leptomonas seymouri]|eukprot:KPI86708.1 putative RNA editing complex protein MP90 putative nuclease [Leptomonas seymouri]